MNDYQETEAPQQEALQEKQSIPTPETQEEKEKIAVNKLGEVESIFRAFTLLETRYGSNETEDQRKESDAKDILQPERIAIIGLRAKAQEATQKFTGKPASTIQPLSKAA